MSTRESKEKASSSSSSTSISSSSSSKKKIYKIQEETPEELLGDEIISTKDAERALNLDDIPAVLSGNMNERMQSLLEAIVELAKGQRNMHILLIAVSNLFVDPCILLY